jgi:hypothetical protein
MRLYALSALSVGCWYLAQGKCDDWWSISLLHQFVVTTLMVVYLFTVVENILMNKPCSYHWLAMVGMFLTPIYWYFFVASDPHIMSCRGLNSVIIGGTGMLLFFTVNFIEDLRYAINKS